MYASSILAVISFVSMVLCTIHNNATDNIPLSVCVQLSVTLLLCTVAIVVNTRCYDFKTGENIISALDNGIREFYDKYYSDSIATQNGKSNPKVNK